MFHRALLNVYCVFAIALSTGALLGQAVNDCAAAKVETHKQKAQALNASCELSIGQSFLSAGYWTDAASHCSTSATLDPGNPVAVQCLRTAGNSAWSEWAAKMEARIKLASGLAEHSTTASLAELQKLRSDALARPKIGSGGPIERGIDQRLAAETNRVTAKQHLEWPHWLPDLFGVAEWGPGVVASVGRIVLFTIAIVVIVFVVYLVRLLDGRLYWSRFHFPISWRVVTISDKTDQSAAGALMDALNARYNPLFSELYTSSFLAIPPGLSVPPMDDGKPLVLRNFLIEAEHPTCVRPYISTWIEDLDRSEFEKHKFRQVDAFEEINLKLGAIEASLGALVRNFQSWWYKGRPTVTGSVGFEDVYKTKFASIRLVAHYGDEDKLLRQTVRARGAAELTLQQVFSQEQTLSVFASTQVDFSTDAVSLASQRAAFRLLYRLHKAPDDSSLAIAASCFRQGVRLLNVSLSRN